MPIQTDVIPLFQNLGWQLLVIAFLRVAKLEEKTVYSFKVKNHSTDEKMKKVSNLIAPVRLTGTLYNIDL